MLEPSRSHEDEFMKTKLRSADEFDPRLRITVAPPLAGISRTSRLRFLAFDAVGAGLYSVIHAGLGHVFNHDLDRAAGYVSKTREQSRPKFMHHSSTSNLISRDRKYRQALRARKRSVKQKSGQSPFVSLSCDERAV
jgi:hypothetical protein